MRSNPIVSIPSLSLLVLALLSVCACGAFEAPIEPTGIPTSAPRARSMKGYEMYSWQMRGVWYFSLVVGTDRLKTYDEISSPELRIQGLEALESELDELPGGEQVFWSAQRVANTAWPPERMIEEISAYCRERGIQLEIEQNDVAKSAQEEATQR
ncbi:MAG: hypothetical protein GTO63_08050 [Anaerolineae bacterium]|nr:hypothetical protein [Anaerolineae bacterium]NIN94882.1 hypothetical protein [Anaerolineae bacterium]NIQ77933.1 hypothetical protein [Anaerolineae bacterium]